MNIEIPDSWTTKVVDEALAIVDDRIDYWRRKRGDKPRGMVEGELERLRIKLVRLRK